MDDPSSTDSSDQILYRRNPNNQEPPSSSDPSTTSERPSETFIINEGYIARTPHRHTGTDYSIYIITNATNQPQSSNPESEHISDTPQQLFYITLNRDGTYHVANNPLPQDEGNNSPRRQRRWEHIYPEESTGQENRQRSRSPQ